MFKNSVTLIIALFFACSYTTTQANEKNIYKQYNEDGVVEFSDVPSKRSKSIHVPHMNTYKQKPLPKTFQKKLKQEPAAHYSNISITSPANDSIVRANNGSVTVTLSVNPSLKPGDSIKLILSGDQNSALVGRNTSFSFSNISRGTHKLQAFIINNEGQTLIQSNTVVFHLKRVSVHH